ncbi:hypothetical protein PMO31116_00537 [Pandoraea morbifera]|uniref:Uncharacterized protein n=1 Tax=Pandoraea morbifera TaxID=2508300 RepID=A0A5E4S283_9BURK|nr:hypothetical protein [Pandoraea morbifera]VVD69727.1 hypothetical protein PMO31116_00537 [Pandoraea morbifera]
MTTEKQKAGFPTFATLDKTAILCALPPWGALYIQYHIFNMVFGYIRTFLLVEQGNVQMNHTISKFPYVLLAVILSMATWLLFPQDSVINTSTWLVQAIYAAFWNTLNLPLSSFNFVTNPIGI